MFGVKHKRDVEYPRFKLCIAAVKAKHIKKIFCGGERRRRLVDEEAGIPPQVIVIGKISVDRHHREHCDKLNTLAEDIRNIGAVGVKVIGIHRQHRAREGVHHICARRLHYQVADEGIRQRAVSGDKLSEVSQLRRGGKLSEKQQIRSLLEAEPPLCREPADKLLHVVAAVIKLSGTGVSGIILCSYLRYLGKTGQNSLSVQVAQSSVHVILGIHRRFDIVALLAEPCQGFYLRSYLGIVSFSHFSSSFS